MSKTDFETYTDLKGKVRWRLTASNGEIVDASSQGFSDKRECLLNAQRSMRGLQEAFARGELGEDVSGEKETGE